MTGRARPLFTKTYSTSNAAAIAAAHHRWLGLVAEPGSIPTLYRHEKCTLVFEHVDGPTARPDDLPDVAAALGRLHRRARERDLHAATTNTAVTTDTSLHVPGFATLRREPLHTRLDPRSSPLTHQMIDHWLDAADHLPVALYKDSNPRNVIRHPARGTVFVDFDDLTLAPCGYDLAKLVVTTTMTTGAIPAALAAAAINAYVDALAVQEWTHYHDQIQLWAEFHHVLSRPWRGQHYHHDWNINRPWPIPALEEAPDCVRPDRMTGGT